MMLGKTSKKPMPKAMMGSTKPAMNKMAKPAMASKMGYKDGGMCAPKKGKK
jgi:hypothetical protein